MKDLSSIGTINEIQIDSKNTLRYLKAGSGDPIVLLHTIRTQLEYFQEVIPELSRHYTVYALDLPGHGYSSVDKTANYDELYLRKGVIAFIEKLDLQHVTLAGESIGGVLSLTVAAAIPERISKIVASNVYDYDTRYADGVRRGNFFANFILANMAIPIHGAIFAALENWLLLGVIMKGGLKKRRWLPRDLLTKLDRAGRKKGYRYVERNVFSNWRSWGMARAAYSAVKAPVKLVYGDSDWSSLQERQRTAKALGANMITLENTGHFGFVDNPKALIKVILDK
ncbi:MAG TPA: alpha/beta hydrolase [Methylophilaceae bacterium]|nr:alpha/beta hydrolase [Methylophilaceae bacterium]